MLPIQRHSSDKGTRDIGDGLVEYLSEIQTDMESSVCIATHRGIVVYIQYKMGLQFMDTGATEP
jgi:hypothetical protein